ncbi:MAG: alanine--tRNA ligase [Deltaproteobacteria bacterium]|nr:alanine--tRNA ligase [Deltaproteobacteria bacterium]
MKKRSGSEVRSLFLKYFEKQAHTIVKSSPLVPRSDPSLLFTNAGMVQFKGVFLGMENRDYVRAVSSQKCFRASGKHNDLENVGYTSRHHTFFEMLGNFSFGDYFKEEAVEMSWNFLTNSLEVPPERLWVTIYEEDDEAEIIWNQKTGIPFGRIIRMGKKDNYWAMGDTGPCGPCSEIHYDQGPEMGCGRPDCAVGCDCDRYLELWNLVFMQFNQDKKGVKTPLPKPSIDTGMGLERISAVVQGAKSNYESDLFSNIITFIEELSEKEYGKESSDDISLRVIADHSRALAFLISNGILPSNEGRGYVLRRVIRRAVRHGRKLGLDRPFLYQTTGIVVDTMRDAYPELVEARNFIAQAVKNEEERFSETLEVGLQLLQEEIEKMKKANQNRLPGNIVFKLYDTFGFPVDLTADIVREMGISIDEEGFNAAMSSQRTKAREAWKGSGEETVQEVYQKLGREGVKTVFKGYEFREWKSAVIFVITGDKMIEEVSEGATAQIITSETPFYGESGGQVGDSGWMEGDGWKAEVVDTLRPLPDIIVHQVKVIQGKIAKGAEARLLVDVKRRRAVAANHTTTHILQSVLREVLGDHVHQEGSLVTPERFRFDFTHFSPLTKRELKRIEELVNLKIQENAPVKVGYLSLEEALERGTVALFGEKYGETVRMVEVGNYSRELCGGTHAEFAGDTGFFKLINETGVAAGVRRIEAVTGQGAWQYIRTWQEEIEELESILKTPGNELVGKVKKMLEEEKQLKREVDKVKAQLASSNSRDLLNEVKTVNGIKVLAAQVDITDPRTLRDFADKMRERLSSGIVVLGAKNEGKAIIVVMVTKDLIAKFPAGEVIKQIVSIVGGRGGGRPDIAQAGGKRTEKLEEALTKTYEIIAGMKG